LFEPPGQYWGAPDVPPAEPAEEPRTELPAEERAEPAEEAATEWSDAASPEMAAPDGDEEAAVASVEVPEEPEPDEPAEIVAETPAEPEPDEPAETVAEAAAEPEPEVLSEPAAEAPAETSTEAPEAPAEDAEDAAEDTEDAAPEVAEPTAADRPDSEHAAPYAFGPAGRPGRPDSPAAPEDDAVDTSAAAEPLPISPVLETNLYDGTTAEALMDALTPTDYADAVRQFRVDVARGLDALESAFLTHNTGAMERSSHLLAGAAATMGARALERRARAVNQLCRNGEFLSVTTEMIVMLRAMADRTLAGGPPALRQGRHGDDMRPAQGVAD
ncbi:MAG: Hpt domain-containing protein, partial [Rhodospirillaceae bacterium]|nr:Hpt domain-containing protein [Rhodospirillaceae bacterium]